MPIYDRTLDVGVKLRALRRQFPERYLGTCTACDLPKELHFADPHCTGPYLGCASALDIGRYLIGHRLPWPSDENDK